MRSLTVVAACSLLLSACSSTNLVPPAATLAANAADSASTSAVRGPAVSHGVRTTDHNSAVPWPATASPTGLSGIPWPLSAIPWLGATNPATSSGCDGVDKSNGKSKAKSGNADANGNGKADCKAVVNASDPIVADALAPLSSILGLQPAMLQYIYNLPVKGGAGQTVAIVVAYDDPAAESDLAIYRLRFGLPPCTSKNGCFSKIAGDGTQTLPPPDYGWSIEASLDVDAVSAVCSQCNIMLVEAASSQIPDLANAVDVAVAHGATEVSNSYGAAEASDNVQSNSHFNHPGVAITAAAGDVGYGAQFPASSQYVTAVGGTSLKLIGTSTLEEIVWPSTGSGCSQFIPKPSYQTDAWCPMRAVNDVAVVADPATGLAVYDSSINGPGNGGWAVIGGTSLGAPLVASMYALAAKHGVGSAASLYAAFASHAGSLLDVTSGSDGICASHTPALCHAMSGFDAPSGVGVPWGVGAFAP